MQRCSLGEFLRHSVKMRAKLFKKFSIFILGFALLCSIQTPNQKIKDLQMRTDLGAEAILSQILPIVFSERLKEWKYDPIQSKLVVSYGGHSALTFDRKEEYSENLTQEHALFSLRLVWSTSHLDLNSLVLLLKKPIYIEETETTEEEIMEIDLLQTNLNKSEIKTILDDLDGLDPFIKKGANLHLTKPLTDIRKIWKVEKNQIPNINVK